MPKRFPAAVLFSMQSGSVTAVLLTSSKDSFPLCKLLKDTTLPNGTPASSRSKSESGNQFPRLLKNIDISVRVGWVPKS
jgi:hypothetical protein